jgi:hypothetical protein
LMRLVSWSRCVVFVAQWIRHPPTKREIAGSSPVEDYSFTPFLLLP